MFTCIFTKDKRARNYATIIMKRHRGGKPRLHFVDAICVLFVCQHPARSLYIFLAFLFFAILRFCVFTDFAKQPVDDEGVEGFGLGLRGVGAALGGGAATIVQNGENFHEIYKSSIRVYIYCTVYRYLYICCLRFDVCFALDCRVLFVCLFVCLTHCISY